MQSFQKFVICGTEKILKWRLWSGQKGVKGGLKDGKYLSYIPLSGEFSPPPRKTITTLESEVSGRLVGNFSDAQIDG